VTFSSKSATNTAEFAELLVNWFTESKYVIALSGGVDSCVVAKAASLSGKTCIAFTSDSPSVPRDDIQAATEVAKLVDIEHRIISTSETLDEDYIRNDERRCYFCKSHLYQSIASNFSDDIVVNGTNSDDLGDYRPGIEAAKENQVRSPLVELKFGKRHVRELAKFWSLPTKDKPASPCLASRIAYGVPVTHERLRMIEEAEQLIRKLGIQEFRVRLHAGNLARIEVPRENFEQILQPECHDSLTKAMKEIGFLYVTLDLAGFKSGSLNQLLQLSVNEQGAFPKASDDS